jgi:putative endonuclease
VTPGAAKQEALRVGVREETCAYWYLRRLGYVFVMRNYEPRREKGELDLVGFDGDTLAFVEVRTRALEKGRPALPELSITREKHQVLVRTAHAFLRERHVKKCPVRFDVVAIDDMPGKPPIARLHKNALSPKA